MLKRRVFKIPTKFNILYIKFSSNNVLTTITNSSNKVLAASSSGRFDFKGHKKITTAALNQTLNCLLKDYLVRKTPYLLIRISGSNSARVGLLRYLSNINYSIVAIEEYFAFPYNGCRPKKRRKV